MIVAVIAIDVERIGEDAARHTFRVTVREGSSTTHRVTLSTADHARLARPTETPEDFVRRCFEFLLEREAKESILSSFDVMVIARYFPEFERAIAGPLR
jgi:hypothetical protein